MKYLLNIQGKISQTTYGMSAQYVDRDIEEQLF